MEATIFQENVAINDSVTREIKRVSTYRNYINEPFPDVERGGLEQFQIKKYSCSDT